MKWSKASYALLAALLFGASTPAAKFFVKTIEPLMLAGLLYLGSGVGLRVYLAVTRWRSSDPLWPAQWKKRELPFLLGAIFSGGIVAPVLLMFGLHRIAASTSSLLLNLEGAFTAALACLVFHEHYGRRLVIGLGFILAGGAILSFSGDFNLSGNWLGIVSIVAACAGWAVDNNLTRQVVSLDAPLLAAVKGLVAGTVNVTLAVMIGQRLAGPAGLFGAAAIGFLGYGVSLVFFILSLRKIGTARTSAYFSTAPFIGTIVSVVMLHESFDWPLLGAGILMGIGVYLHLTEVHGHEHQHEFMEHEHMHVHDEHHQHEHLPSDPPSEPHSHWHRHLPFKHAHPHEHEDSHHKHSH